MNKTNDNAKVDWLKRVKRHRKKQKGLALSTLNTNAGNVEHNINMFNMMQPQTSASVNPMNGVADSACAESAGMSQSLCESRTSETVTLEYKNLPIEVITRRGDPNGVYSVSFGNWLPDYSETAIIKVSWDYVVDKHAVIDVLQDDPDVQEELGIDDLTEAEYDAKLLENFDELVDKYNSVLLAVFYDDAVEDAEERYHDNDYLEDSDDYYEDDDFDMSTRTLL